MEPYQLCIDENMNAVLDEEEPGIKDCEKDDFYNFYSDNNGSISENNNVCTPAPSPSFSWQLPGNDPNKIEFLG